MASAFDQLCDAVEVALQADTPGITVVRGPKAKDGRGRPPRVLMFQVGGTVDDRKHFPDATAEITHTIEVHCWGGSTDTAETREATQNLMDKAMIALKQCGAMLGPWDAMPEDDANRASGRVFSFTCTLTRKLAEKIDLVDPVRVALEHQSHDCGIES